MSLEAFRSAINSRFASIMGANHPTVTLTYDNIKYAQPRSGEWANISINPMDYNRANLGSSPTFRNQGEVIFHVMAMNNAGTSEVFEIVQTLLDNMGDQELSISVGSAHTYGAQIMNRGVIEGWFTVEVQISYKYDA